MTIIPNLLVSGILAVVFSLAFLVWAVAFVERRHTSLVMFGLSLAMLLVGSGFGPALLGIILAIGSRGFKKPNAPRASAKDKSKFQFLSKIWPWLFGACLLSWLFLFPASSALDYLFSIDSTNILFGAIPFAFLSLIALIIISTAKDSLSD